MSHHITVKENNIMKRIFLTGILIVALVTAMSTTAFASAKEENAASNINYQVKTITPYFVGVATAKAIISFDGNMANATIAITPKTSTSIDYVKVSAKLMKVGSSTPIKSWSQTVSASGSGNFIFSEEKSISASGKYYVKATVKCYKNSTVADTLNIESQQLQYN